MSSSPEERLYAVYEAYSKAYDRRPQDWKEAATKGEADAIFRNVERLEAHYLKAAKQSLDANGQAVEAAYQAAKNAQKDVDDAYEKAKKLAERIKLVGGIVGKIGDLVKKAGEL